MVVCMKLILAHGPLIQMYFWVPIESKHQIISPSFPTPTPNYYRVIAGKHDKTPALIGQLNVIPYKDPA